MASSPRLAEGAFEGWHLLAAVDALVGVPHGDVLPAIPLSPLRETSADSTLAGFRAWLVPHTHWDREWYMPFEHFRMRLARMLEDLADVMEGDARIGHFTLDGQTVILEDCAELRPDVVERLRKLADAGRLSVGPGYVMPDEFLPGPESLVRNLLHGQDVARRFGFEPMPLGYSPDPFGHPAQLPQILAGFGFRDFIFWRGLGDEADQLGAVFSWSAPDGSTVLAHQMLGSYGNANQLGSWLDDGVPIESTAQRAEAAATRPIRFVARHGEALRRSSTRDLLLCNGSDHEPIQRDISDVAAAMAQAHPGLSVEVCGYGDYTTAVRASLPAALPSHVGEMVDGRIAPVLRGINSARMPLKQAYAATEEALLVAESAAALAALRAGASYPAAELRHGWRELLRNAPHDSVSGCSVDETHETMESRFAAATLIADRVRREAVAALSGAEARWSHREPVEDAYSVLNLLPWRRSGIVEVRLPEQLHRGELRAIVDGAGVSAQRSARRPDRAWALLDLPSYGGATVAFSAQAAADDAPQSDSAAKVRVIGDRRLESDVLSVEVAADGSLTIEDRLTGRRWQRTHVFEDVADRGDEYNFCPVDGDSGVTSTGTLRSVRVMERGPLVAELEVRLSLRLPAALTGDRKARSRRWKICTVLTTVRVTAGSRRIDFRTTVDNRSRDHRLRVLFPTGTNSRTVQAEGAYALLTRDARPRSDGIGWVESPSPTQHTRGLVASGAIAVSGRGLPEYEALQGPDGLTLALTLLRCVGWLSRDDLSTRRGGAGPALEVPDAQCLGTHTFEYVLWVGEADAATRLRDSAEWRRPLVQGQAGVQTRPFLALEGSGFADGALKMALDGDGVVLRVFAGPDGGCIQFPRDLTATACRLDEQPLPPSARRPGRGQTIELAPAKIASWRLSA